MESPAARASHIPATDARRASSTVLSLDACNKSCGAATPIHIDEMRAMYGGTMNQDQIYQGVRQQLELWTGLSRSRGRPRELTEGAVHLLVQLISNIENDPSPYWKDSQYDSAQQYVIATLPNILIDIDSQFGQPWMGQRISSWELLHGISPALSRWCPIPKDI